MGIRKEKKSAKAVPSKPTHVSKGKVASGAAKQKKSGSKLGSILKQAFLGKALGKTKKKAVQPAPKKAAKKAASRPVAVAKKVDAKKNLASAGPGAARAGSAEVAPKSLKNSKAPAGRDVKTGVAPQAAKGKAAVYSIKGRTESAGIRALDNGDVCREVACEGLATAAGYCRLHYIKNWKKVKRKELILKEKKLNQYIEELVAKYPDKYIEAIRQDLANDKDFAKVIYDLDLDESVDDFDVEGENVDSLIDNIKRDFEDEGESF
ncbi:MAG: hypothetical protein A2428_01695 [Bdellovibrionales bacterium RIFOXYC1_FULL_54_43]|nr:MAG: hypothetical protein A2428_01695 [Bdellovibrionales bacterium RIFOXYC1_FULL_54_43]OFZ83653.1 MAG: hypothetical protein A2603_16505 [Bdellovibrionales bacterium RIFOXYD1_FULL_55_31]